MWKLWKLCIFNEWHIRFRPFASSFIRSACRRHTTHSDRPRGRIRTRCRYGAAHTTNRAGSENVPKVEPPCAVPTWAVVHKSSIITVAHSLSIAGFACRCAATGTGVAASELSQRPGDIGTIDVGAPESAVLGVDHAVREQYRACAGPRIIVVPLLRGR